jgi:hypothetical protein
MDNDGNLSYQSFVSAANGPNGHTEILALKFLQKNNIPTENLLRLHSEKIPCATCTEALLNTTSNTKITWDFNSDAAGNSARDGYIKNP